MSSGLIGVGLRPTHYSFLESGFKNPSVQLLPRWFEAISENYMDTRGRPLEMLLKTRKSFPVALHGVSLSIGSTDDLDMSYLSKLKELIAQVDPFIVSDHVCWTGAHGRNLHDLLPLPFNNEALAHLTDRIGRVQDYLGRELVLENVSAYLRFRENDYSEWDFLNELSKRSGAKLLLDINNLYVNAMNHGFDPYEYADSIKIENVAQIHLAGYSDMGDFLFDTHSKNVAEPVWQLYGRVIAKNRAIPTLIEWDEDIPAFEILEGEVRRALEIANGRPELKRVES